MRSLSFAIAVVWQMSQHVSSIAVPAKQLEVNVLSNGQIKQDDDSAPVMLADTADSVKMMSTDKIFNAVIGYSVADILDYVVKAVKDGQAPTPEEAKAITDTRRLVKDEIVPEMKSSRDNAEKQAGSHVKTIGECDQTAVLSLAAIKDQTETIVGLRRTAHSACRKQQITKNATQLSKCDKVKELLAGRAVPNEDLVAYIKATNDQGSVNGPMFTAWAQECAAATDELANHKADCDRKQTAFEMAFCTWMTELTATCGTHSMCFDGAEKSYGTFLTDTSALVGKWKHETEKLEKFDCSLGVWLTGASGLDSSSGNGADPLQHCKDLRVDTSHIDISFPKTPDKSKCDTTPVQNHPGTANFVNLEYAEFSKFALDATHCLEKPTVKPAGDNNKTVVVNAPTECKDNCTGVYAVVSWASQKWGAFDKSKASQIVCVAKEATHVGTGKLFTSCCRDAPGSALSYAGGAIRVCGKDEIEKPWVTAESACMARGQRLCTAQEILNGATAEEGCGVDGPQDGKNDTWNRAWSNTPCNLAEVTTDKSKCKGIALDAYFLLCSLLLVVSAMVRL
jgi:hypothetical protein